MSTTLSHHLKGCMPTLCRDSRWNVLTVLILHTNIRNRCYVGMDTIAEMATNGNLTKATRAKKWLELHGAFELVAYDKRVAEERNLPKRQHLYQLTGTLRQCGFEKCECQKWMKSSFSYLYYGKHEDEKANVLTIQNIKTAQSSDHSEHDTADVLTIDNIDGQNVSKYSSISNKSSNPSNKDNVAPDGAGEVTATPRKPVHRSDEFKLVALESFAIADVAALDKNTVILVNKIMAWLKTNSPNANVDTLKAFYLWYDSKINAARPRDAAKFGAHFTAFKQQHLLTKRTPPEVIRLPNAVPHEFSVNEFVRKERMHD